MLTKEMMKSFFKDRGHNKIIGREALMNSAVMVLFCEIDGEIFILFEKRAEGLNAIDRGLKIRRSHENPYVKAMYDKYLDYPLSHKAHELLHTKYFPKFKQDTGAVANQ